MIYLDNAATSRFKPKSVIDALNFNVLNSANSGRGSHNEAVRATLQIENCRNYLKLILGADDSYEVIFTKSCTEALNLAILGSIKQNEVVVTSQNEHNSVLRPLYLLQSQGKITLIVLEQDENGKIPISAIEQCANDADVFVFGGASNVTGSTLDLYEVGKIAKQHNVRFIVDGAQCVPIVDVNVKKCDIDMIACPAHKGLHAVQGVGFLLVKRDTDLQPLIYGGTGTSSQDLLPPIQMPESYEAGTMFTAGIAALREGAKWSVENIQKTRKNLVRLSNLTISNLNYLNARVYTKEVNCGIVSFNIFDLDSTLVADCLNEYGICVRAGLHCAPLVHKSLGTTSQGAVRVSIGCDTTDKDILVFSKAVERIIEKYHAKSL